MKTVRLGVFETNSSSTHSITMCSKADYTKWKKDKNLLIELESGVLKTREEVIEKLKKNKYCSHVDWNDKESVSDALHENDWLTYKEYRNQEMEDSYKEYKTSGGEVVVAFGTFGYDY